MMCSMTHLLAPEASLHTTVPCSAEEGVTSPVPTLQQGRPVISVRFCERAGL